LDGIRRIRGGKVSFGRAKEEDLPNGYVIAVTADSPKIDTPT